MPAITLLTDFGTRDGYIGEMKGVIQTIYPGVSTEDVAHDLPRGDIGAGCRALQRYWARWPVGTVHLAVVDPGVESDRRALVVEADRRLFVAPDNGILSGVFAAAEAWEASECTNPQFRLPDPSHTFHGRDIFAPAAAYLARGVHPVNFGPTVAEPLRLPITEPEQSGGEWLGQVESSDRFGNLITNLPWDEIPEGATVELDGVPIPLGRSYSDVPSRHPVALGNSDGRLEVATRDASAAELLDAGVGTPVRVRLDST